MATLTIHSNRKNEGLGISDMVQLNTACKIGTLVKTITSKRKKTVDTLKAAVLEDFWNSGTVVSQENLLQCISGKKARKGWTSVINTAAQSQILSITNTTQEQYCICASKER